MRKKWKKCLYIAITIVCVWVLINYNGLETFEDFVTVEDHELRYVPDFHICLPTSLKEDSDFEIWLQLDTPNKFASHVKHITDRLHRLVEENFDRYECGPKYPCNESESITSWRVSRYKHLTCYLLHWELLNQYKQVSANYFKKTKSKQLFTMEINITDLDAIYVAPKQFDDRAVEESDLHRIDTRSAKVNILWEQHEQFLLPWPYPTNCHHFKDNVIRSRNQCYSECIGREALRRWNRTPDDWLFSHNSDARFTSDGHTLKNFCDPLCDKRECHSTIFDMSTVIKENITSGMMIISWGLPKLTKSILVHDMKYSWAVFTSFAWLFILKLRLRNSMATAAWFVISLHVLLSIYTAQE